MSHEDPVPPSGACVQKGGSDMGSHGLLVKPRGVGLKKDSQGMVRQPQKGNDSLSGYLGPIKCAKNNCLRQDLLGDHVAKLPVLQLLLGAH
jgi:hypothetical protein